MKRCILYAHIKLKTMQDVQKVVITGIARDVSRYLPEVLINIDIIRSILEAKGVEVPMCFFISDIADTTLEILRAWSSARRSIVLLFEENTEARFPKRIERLAYGRNQARAYVIREHRDASAVIVMDLDDVNMKIDIAAIAATLNKLAKKGGVDVYGANQEDKYYDRSALLTTRTKRPCLNANWPLCFGLCRGYGLCTGLTTNSLTFRSDALPIDVESCFGGLAIYSARAFLERECVYSERCDKEEQTYARIPDQEICEHVSFHQCLKRTNAARGIVIEPSLLNEGQYKEKRHALAVVQEPISSRTTPRAFFHWSKHYLQADTETRAPRGFFARVWRETMAAGRRPTIIWLRMGSHAQHKRRCDVDAFAEEVLRHITYSIVLITGDGDAGPDDLGTHTLRSLRNSGHVAAWFSQNCISVGTFWGLDLKPFPIGLDSKLDNTTLMHSACNGADVSLPFPPVDTSSTPLVAVDCHIHLSDTRRASRAVPVMKGCSRKEVAAALKRVNHGIAVKNRVPRQEVHQVWKRACFVACCEGNGVDCHRTYEVIALGRIPVVPDRPAVRAMLSHAPVVFSSNLARDLSDPDVLKMWWATLRPQLVGEAARYTRGAQNNCAGLWLSQIQAARYTSAREEQFPGGFLEWDAAAALTSPQMLSTSTRPNTTVPSFRFKSLKILLAFAVLACFSFVFYMGFKRSSDNSLIVR